MTISLTLRPRVERINSFITHYWSFGRRFITRILISSVGEDCYSMRGCALVSFYTSTSNAPPRLCFFLLGLLFKVHRRIRLKLEHLCEIREVLDITGDSPLRRRMTVVVDEVYKRLWCHLGAPKTSVSDEELLQVNLYSPGNILW